MKAQTEAYQRLRDFQATEGLERLRFAVDFARSGINTMMLVNGGALIGLFTLVGSGNFTLSMKFLWWAFLGFATGLVATLAASLLAYLSQNQFYICCTRSVLLLDGHQSLDGQPIDAARPMKIGNRYVLAATFCATLTIVAFVFGCGMALAGFTA